MKPQTLIEDVLIVCGISVSIIDIQQILSIILLVFNICWILWKCGYRIYTHIKTKQYEEIENDIKTGIDEIETLKDDSEKK